LARRSRLGSHVEPLTVSVPLEDELLLATVVVHPHPRYSARRRGVLGRMKGFGDELGAVESLPVRPTLETDVLVMKRGVDQGSHYCHDDGLAAASANK